MFILLMECLTVNLISIDKRDVHFCVKIGSHEGVHIIVKNI